MTRRPPLARRAAPFLLAAALPATLSAQRAPTAPPTARPTATPTDTMANEQVAGYDWVRPEADYVRRTEMVPMRDGTRLYTVIVYRKGAHDAPILLSRTPYDADKATSRNRSRVSRRSCPSPTPSSSTTAISASTRTCAGWGNPRAIT